MMSDDRMRELLRSALPPAPDRGPTRDLWPLVVARMRPPDRWSWLDVGLAAAVVAVLLMFPEYASLLAYHL
jgi:hypothetical protein